MMNDRQRTRTLATVLLAATLVVAGAIAAAAGGAGPSPAASQQITTVRPIVPTVVVSVATTPSTEATVAPRPAPATATVAPELSLIPGRSSPTVARPRTPVAIGPGPPAQPQPAEKPLADGRSAKPPASSVDDAQPGNDDDHETILPPVRDEDGDTDTPTNGHESDSRGYSGRDSSSAEQSSGD